MRRYSAVIWSLASLLWFNPVYGEHLQIRNASNLTAGTLPNERLDKSSATMQGNVFNQADRLLRLDGSGNVNLPGATFTGSVFSGNGSALTGITFTGTRQKAYDIVIGTLGATSADVDIASNTEDGIMEAVNRIAGSVNATIGHGIIGIKSGLYTIKNATIPYGMTVVALGSVTWQAERTDVPMFTNYGRVSGINYDFKSDSMTMTNKVISLKSNSRLENFQIFRSSSLSDTLGSGKKCQVCVEQSSNVVIQGKIWNITNTLAKNGASIYISSSQKVDMKIDIATYTQQNVENCVFLLENSTDIAIHDSIFDSAGGRFIALEGPGKNYFIERNYFRFNNAAAGSNAGLLSMDPRFWGATVPNDGVMISTAILVANNRIEVASTGAGRIVVAGGPVHGLTLLSNFVYGSLPDTTYTGTFFLITGTSVRGVRCIGNNIISGTNSYIVDNGQGTNCTGSDVYNLFIDAQP